MARPFNGQESLDACVIGGLDEDGRLLGSCVVEGADDHILASECFNERIVRCQVGSLDRDAGREGGFGLVATESRDVKASVGQ